MPYLQDCDIEYIAKSALIKSTRFWNEPTFKVYGVCLSLSEADEIISKLKAIDFVYHLEFFSIASKENKNIKFRHQVWGRLK